MKNPSAVTFRGHLPVILSAKSKGSEDMKQILIVEDDSFLNKMVAYNLTADGYGVTSALNARTAADAIRQREFDLVLLDINLPDGNGFELCKLIKPQHPDTIVIFLTANDQESDQIRGYEVGAVEQHRGRPSPGPKRLAPMVPATYTRCFKSGYHSTT